MIEWTKDIFTWWTTGLLGFLLYWLPVGFCLVGYVFKTWGDYRHDLKARDSDTFYRPRLHVGTIIGRAITSVVPVANLCAAVFDVAPSLFGKFIDWIEAFFSIPLVKPRPKKDAAQ